MAGVEPGDEVGAFNSASTLSSRRTGHHPGQHPLGGVPSIRPRRCRRGERADLNAGRRSYPVAFNSASTLSSRRTRWGHQGRTVLC